MSTIEADVITSASSNTDLSVSGKGSGVPDIEAGFKVGGTVGVPTASIQDDSVTLAKMASATDGVIITYDASGNPTHVGPGTDGQVLTSTGAGSPPAFEDAGGGGAWNLIGTAVASNSASLTVTGLDSTYDTYAIALSDLHPATNNVGCWLRCGDSSGIDSGGSDYQSHTSTVQFNSGSYSGNGWTIDRIPMGNSAGSGTGQGFGAMVYLHRPGDGTMFPSFTGVAITNQTQSFVETQRGGHFFGARVAVITLDRIQFLFDTSNIVSGRMTVWGISHA